MFNNEVRQFEPGVFSVMDALFGDVDSFVPDPELQIELESQNPGFYLDEPTLRTRVSKAYEELVALTRRAKKM
jgi:hypothetical protein